MYPPCMDSSFLLDVPNSLAAAVSSASAYPFQIRVPFSNNRLLRLHQPSRYPFTLNSTYPPTARPQMRRLTSSTIASHPSCHPLFLCCRAWDRISQSVNFQARPTQTQINRSAAFDDSNPRFSPSCISSGLVIHRLSQLVRRRHHLRIPGPYHHRNTWATRIQLERLAALANVRLHSPTLYSPTGGSRRRMGRSIAAACASCGLWVDLASHILCSKTVNDSTHQHPLPVDDRPHNDTDDRWRVHFGTTESTITSSYHSTTLYYVPPDKTASLYHTSAARSTLRPPRLGCRIALGVGCLYSVEFVRRRTRVSQPPTFTLGSTHPAFRSRSAPSVAVANAGESRCFFLGMGNGNR